MQRKGVLPYIVLEDDSAWKGYDHTRYYREIIACYGDLPAMVFNFGEEHNENYSLDQALAYMQELKRIDPYNHPRGIHNVNQPSAKYANSNAVNFTSIQTKSRDPLMHNQLTLDWMEICKEQNTRMLMVNYDEGRPELNRKAWWSAYIAGAVWEAHVLGPYDRPMDTWEDTWIQLGGARAFMESLPFWEMQPHNKLITEGKAFCLAKPGEAYAVYIPENNPITIRLKENTQYQYSWWNPENGVNGTFERQGQIKGGVQTFHPPQEGDWTLRIMRTKN